MPKKKSYPTATDQFCGSGGSGQGAKKAGVEIILGLNHWKLATETYSSNFPDAHVECTDVSASDPRRYPSTDILITSPECTTHSPAGGNNHKALKKQMDMFNYGKIDPATERSRATMWDVCRFAEYHDYNLIVVENVIEAKTRWQLFDIWLSAMHRLGYEHKCLYFNSMHFHPTPQSRDRMYVVFWKKGNKTPDLNYAPAGHCTKCNYDVYAIQSWKNKDKHFGKYRVNYIYTCPKCGSTVEPYFFAAFNCIDWSNFGNKISERKKPLSPNTIKRIKYGLDKYAAHPLILNIAHGNSGRKLIRDVFQTMYAQTTAQSQAIVNPPFLVNTLNGKNDKNRHRSTGEPLFAQTTYNGQMIINHPFIINDQHSTGIEFRTKSTSEAIHTFPTTHQTKLLIPPFLTEMYGTGKARAISEGLNTVTSGGIKTGLVTNDAFNAFISSYNNGSHCTKHISEEIGTQGTRDRHSLMVYKEPDINDCYYRMLLAHEVKSAMAFEKDYIILGNTKEQVKQLGNAVTPPVMTWIIKQCMKTLN